MAKAKFAPIPFAPIPVLVCLAESNDVCVEIMESAQSDFPGHAVVLVCSSAKPSPAMRELADPHTHFGFDVVLSWRVSSSWAKRAHPDTVDWVMGIWGQDWMVALEPEVNINDEIADLDEFDRMLGAFDVTET